MFDPITLLASLLAIPIREYEIFAFITSNWVFSPTEIALSPIFLILTLSIDIFDPDKSIASPNISLNFDLDILPSLKSTSIPSDFEFWISKSEIIKFELTKLPIYIQENKNSYKEWID